ncbi:MAG TPA: adenosylcobinamide-GDP ribazoletransferase [Mycobacteriales bacterium]
MRLALSLLTIARLHPAAPTRREARAAMLWAPVVGLGVGFVAALVMFGLRSAAPKQFHLIAVLGVATWVVLTRGLHLDGLADTADGLGSLRAPADAYAVMRRGDVGPLGVATVVLVLLAQVMAVAGTVAVSRGTSAVLVSTTVGRLAATLSCTPRTPPLGDGLGALVVGAVPRAAAFGMSALVLAGTFAGGWFDEGAGLNGGLHAVGAAVLALAAAHALRARCVRRLGGVNGDVLGAQVEVATTVSLVVFALDLWR